ncbi:14920_t:CDS:2, partial [Racocetra persica]
NSSELSEEEKQFAIKDSTWDKNFFNLIKQGRKCLRKDFSNWTSNNSKIGEIIREAQLQMPLPRALTEWIPYIHLEIIEFFKQGGCSSIYTATWTKGLITSFDKKMQLFERTRNIPVVLKFLKGSATANDRLSNERSSNTRFVLVLRKLEGDLRDYIFKNYETLTWKKDLHCGNIMYKNGAWALADLGLTGPSDQESIVVYGSLAYMAPEVAGMLMYQCCSGVPLFYGLDHDSNLMLYICDGIRPTIPETVPQFYKDIMKQCWDADPQKRPKSEELYNLP